MKTFTYCKRCVAPKEGSSILRTSKWNLVVVCIRKIDQGTYFQRLLLRYAKFTPVSKA